MRSTRLLMAAMAFSLACASAPGAANEPIAHRGDPKSLTAADFANATQLNLLDFILAERPRWLRSPDGSQPSVIVYVDDARLGGPATLRSITLSTVATARYYEATAAQQKFSTRDRGPVIEVFTR